MRFLKGTRVPRKHGVPLMTSASIVITGSAIGSSHFSFLGKLGRYPSRRGRTLRGRTPLFPAITQLTRSSFYATIKNHVPEIELLVYRRGERTPFVEWLAGLTFAPVSTVSAWEISETAVLLARAAMSCVSILDQDSGFTLAGRALAL